MDDNISEVTLVEQDLLMTVDEFAKQECVTPRTVYRWIELGRLDTIERLGKKYVNASVPLKTGISDNDNVGNDMKSNNAGAIQSVNLFEEYMKTLRENGKRSEKSCRRWQMSCFVSIFLLVAALLACTSLALLYHYGTESLSGRIEESSAELIKAEDDKKIALSKVDEINAQMELNVKPYKEENARLQKRLDEAIARNDALRVKLDETFGRNITLLERFSEKTETDNEESTETEGTSNNTKLGK